MSHLSDFLVNYANDTSSHPTNVTLIVSAVLTQDGLQSASTRPAHVGCRHRKAIRWRESSKDNKKRKKNWKVFYSNTSFHFATNQMRLIKGWVVVTCVTNKVNAVLKMFHSLNLVYNDDILVYFEFLVLCLISKLPLCKETHSNMLRYSHVVLLTNYFPHNDTQIINE